MPAVLNAALLPGLFVIAAPIIIHLINRNRYQEVSWGAYQLLSSSFQVRARRIKLEELLLLLFRALLLGMFALALCRVVIRHEGLSWGDPLSSNVILIDGSYSMEKETDDGPLFDKARTRAIQLIRELRKGEDVSVVIVGRLPRRLSPKPEFDFERVIREIQTSELRGEPADFVAGVDLALRILSETKNPLRRLFILSDYQDYGWRSEETAKWAYQKAALEELKLSVPSFYLGESVPPKPNFSVSSIRLQGVSVNTSEPAKFAFTVRNYHDKAAACSIIIEKDGGELDRRERTLGAGEAREEALSYRFEKPGRHTLVVRIESDFVPGDNRAYMAVDVLDEIPVLLVDGNETEDFFRSATGYLAVALDAEVRGKDLTPFAPKRIPPDEFADESLSDYRAVVLANIGDFPDPMVSRLERYVEQGGGLLISCGGKTRPSEMARALYRDGQGLLPSAPGRLRTVESGERPFSPFFPGGRSEILPFLAADESQRLAEVLLNRFVECEVTDADQERGVQVLAEIADRKALLVGRKYGKGRVVLWTSSLDVSWGNLPSQWVYVPLVNHLMLYLSAENQNENQVIQGDKIALTLPGGSEDPTVYVMTPDGEVEEMPARPEGKDLVLEYSGTDVPGIYQVSADREFMDEGTKTFAVNVDLHESSPRPLEMVFKEFLAESFTMKFFEGYDEFKKSGQEKGSFDLWRLLILIALAALVAESFTTSRIAKDQQVKQEDVKGIRVE